MRQRSRNSLEVNKHNANVKILCCVRRTPIQQGQSWRVTFPKAAGGISRGFSSGLGDGWREGGSGRQFLGQQPALRRFFGTLAVSSVPPGTQARWGWAPWPPSAASGPTFAVGRPFSAPNSRSSLASLWLLCPLTRRPPQWPEASLAGLCPLPLMVPCCPLQPHWLGASSSLHTIQNLRNNSNQKSF